MTDNNEEINYIRKKQGEYFGYPPCCVRSFLAFMNKKGKRHPVQDKNSHPEGFVPCLKHAKLLDQKQITMRDLIQHRVCSLTFVFDDYMNSDSFRNSYSRSVQDKVVFQAWIEKEKEKKVRK